MIDERGRTLLAQLNRELWEAVSRNSTWPQSMKTGLYFHITKPWIPDFLSVAISPLKDGLKAYLGRPVFNWQNMTFYFPSPAWWTAHLERSHTPNGAGCDATTHTAFLTLAGAEAEFAYVTVLKSGEIKLLGPQDFSEECTFWYVGQEPVKKEEGRPKMTGNVFGNGNHQWANAPMLGPVRLVGQPSPERRQMIAPPIASSAPQPPAPQRQLAAPQQQPRAIQQPGTVPAGSKADCPVCRTFGGR